MEEFARTYKALWASRHPLDPEAEAALRDEFETHPNDKLEVVSQEIIWPADKETCLELARDLDNSEYDILTGVWPAQALEAFRIINTDKLVLSPVSEPVVEPDGTKTRRFRFVRWAKVV